MAQEGVTMDRLTEWIGEGEDRHAIPRMDLRKNGHQACCNKLAEYEDLEETGMISKWIAVIIGMKWTGSAWCLWALFIPAMIE